MTTAISRHSMYGTLLAAGLALAAVGVSAQSYPSRPIEFVVHVTPGGGTDVFARLVTEIMTREKIVTQPLVVVNRPGGSGTIAFTYVKSKRGSPYTVLTMATGSFLAATARTDLDLGLRHFTPLAFFASDPQGIIVNADSKYKTYKELIADAKSQPDTIACSVASAQGTGRQMLWLMERETGTRFKFVAFKSGSEAVLSVLGGHVQVTTENVSEAWAHIEAKKMRVLAVTTEKRMPALPDVPTMLELGSKITIGTGRGFVMPADVPKKDAAAMEALLAQVHKSALWKDYSQKNMYEERWMGSAEFARYLVVVAKSQEEFVKAVGAAAK